ncbi:MAG: oxidoreductase [Bdellovibrionaceae bacterium]|nr:oxidoreductase [Pseudobdellovibrionaceae bacterium]|tara:strand:- start:2419 stop:4557 length:2139 start_codon:yes stop_codon:yes gene_type:complete
MKQLFIRSGQAFVESVPDLGVSDGKVLVKTEYSCISVGTEMGGVKTSAKPLWKRALDEPEKVKQVIGMVAERGLSATKSTVQGKLSAGNPSGYSASGVVIGVGKGVSGFSVGDRVACAGAEYANHAERMSVPENLVVRVPDSVLMKDAATVTLGAIAMQGVRRAQPTLGEHFVVIGMGLLGQLTTQILRANGCQVSVLDLDVSRASVAKIIDPDVNVIELNEGEKVSKRVFELTHGSGADGVIITAAASTDQIVSDAFLMCRKKGRVVLVGDVGLHLKRGDFYRNEIDFLISCSYGPGRYDVNYEEHGVDYPIGYVRWTENRNMQEYLRLLKEKKISLHELSSNQYDFESANIAYSDLNKDASLEKPLLVLLKYSQQTKEEKLIKNPQVFSSSKDKVRVGFLGLGGFANGVHLPHLQKMSKDFHLTVVGSRSSHRASSVMKQFGVEMSTADYSQVIQHPEVDLLFLCTRHHEHGKQVLQGLRSGKHVFVEKPLCLLESELDEIESLYQEEVDTPILMIGFNRRFSPHSRWLKNRLKNRQHPLVIQYQMNVGMIPKDHWIQTKEGGGRNLGEACHIYDLFTYLTGSRCLKVQAMGVHGESDHYLFNDNFSVQIKFEDGSVAHLMYTSMGNSSISKERMNLYCEGQVYELDNFQSLKVNGSEQKKLSFSTPNKGHLKELEVFSQSLRENQWPIELWEQLQATRIAFEVERQIQG